MDLILREVVRYYGPPMDLLSDRGPQFTARFWREFWKQLGVDLSLTQTERTNQELLRYLRCYCSHRPTTWANHLFLAELAHNQLHSSVAGMSPFEAATGISPSWFPGHSPPGSMTSVNTAIHHLQWTWTRVRDSLVRASEARLRWCEESTWYLTNCPFPAQYVAVHSSMCLCSTRLTPHHCRYLCLDPHLLRTWMAHPPILSINCWRSTDRAAGWSF